MTESKFFEILDGIRNEKAENAQLEIKSAHKGYPKKLFDTLSSFSNQDDGGVIVFGVDEAQQFAEVGVYDAHDLQKQVNNQSVQMHPVVRPLFTTVERDGKYFLAAEIPGIDVADRPCYYKGVGRLKGSYIRVGDSDEPMTEYEVYSYEAYRKKYEDEVRVIKRANMEMLDADALALYITHLKAGRSNLSSLPEAVIYNLMSITRQEGITLSALMLFCPYPQALCPMLGVTATVIPGFEIGDVTADGTRFLDNQRMEGTIPQMLEQGIRFVQRNMQHPTMIDPMTGQRQDRVEYPLVAVREALLNALVHRDYSLHTEGMPIQILMFEDRLEIHSPGGIYGRIRVDQLGRIQPDTRNPVIASALEVLRITENRYSGIPTIRNEMEKYGLPAPIFVDDRGTFKVILYKEKAHREQAYPYLHGTADMIKEHYGSYGVDKGLADFASDRETAALLDFLKTPRSKKEISDFLKINSTTYAIKRYVMPLVERGMVKMSVPDKPKSPQQRYYS